MKKIVLPCLVFVGALLFAQFPALAQNAKLDAEFDKNLALLRKDLRSGKKQLVAENMKLTDAEATKFWVVYDQYADELATIYDGRAAIIKDYAANFDKLTDATASDLIKRSIDNEAAISGLRQKYLAKFAKIVPGKKAALFFQIDRRLGLLIDLQLASEIPLAIE